MKRFLAWLLILALMIPAAAFAEGAYGIPLAQGTIVPKTNVDTSTTDPQPVFTQAPAVDQVPAADAIPEMTAAPATQPPATQPPSSGIPEYTYPPVTMVPPTQPPATQPPATQPPATQPPAFTRTLVQGMTGSDVLAAQVCLQGLGYYLGELNGEFNSSLYVAVRNFQYAWNLAHPEQTLVVDGKIGPATRAAMYYGGSKVEPDVTAPVNTFTLEYGMSGPEVLTAQKRLNQLGYYLGELNGEYNSSVEYAVRLFQEKNEITADGKINYATRLLLYSDKAISADTPDYAGTIRYGNTGSAVEQLQLQLRATYYYSGLIDGIFGNAVESAVKAFQASTGLSVDGKVGPRTFDALFNRTASIFNGAIPSRTLSKGSRGYDVYLLQEKLKSLAYKFNNWYQPGYFDDSTVAVVKQFQQKNGLKVTGIYDSTLRRYLWPTTVAQEEADAQQYEAPTIYDSYVGRTLRLHSYGEDVKALQMKLLATGYMTGNVDGIYGALTKAAVLRFQKAYSALYGLKPDGVVGPKTWAAINDVLSANGAEQTVTVDFLGHASAVGGYNRVLRIGSYGSDVKKLQQKLKDLGYDPGKVDGIYGVKTFAAVREFQFYNNLVADGIAGPNTYVVLHWAD